jgi:hypothetical protein
MLPAEDVPNKAENEVWLRSGGTHSRKKLHFHTERDCVRLRKGSITAAQIFTPARERAKVETQGECGDCKSEYNPYDDRKDGSRLARKMKGSDDPRQVLENHDFD